MIVKKRWIALAAFAAFISYQYWSYQKSLGIPPRENADGTIDYTLVDKKANVNGIDRPPVRKEWVLRFPKDVYINGVEQSKVRRLEINGVSLRTNDLPNRSFSFYLNFDDFSLFRENIPEDVPNVLRVLLRSEYLRYGIIAEKAGHRSYAKRHFQYYDLNCTKVKELAPGVIQLRQATLEEARQAIARVPLASPPYDPDLEPRCSTSENAIRISLYNYDNKPVGSGLCYERDNETVGQCDVHVWLPQERMATLFFYQVKLNQFQEAYEAVVRILSQATVSK